MGRVQIPEHVQAGRSRAFVELSRSELEFTLDLLKTAVHELSHPTPAARFPPQRSSRQSSESLQQQQQQVPGVSIQQQRLGQLDINGQEATAPSAGRAIQQQPMGMGARGTPGQPTPAPAANASLPAGWPQGSGASPSRRQGGAVGGWGASPAGRGAVAAGGQQGPAQDPVAGTTLIGRATPTVGSAAAGPNLAVPASSLELMQQAAGVRASGASSANPTGAAGSSPTSPGLPAGGAGQPRGAAAHYGALPAAGGQVSRPGAPGPQQQQPIGMRRPGPSPSPAAAAAHLASAQRPAAPPPALPAGARAASPVAAAAAAAVGRAPPPALPAGVPGLARIPEPGSPWRRLWMTAPGEHSREAVAALAYGAALEGLPGGGGHAGWLMSASRGLLNLWECSAGGGKTETPLQVMHSQAVDYAMESLDLDQGSQMLLAACSHASSQNGVAIALHSLSAESFFAFKGKIRIVPGGIPTAQRQPGAPTLCHVASLQPLGGPLRGSLAAAAGADLLVYELSSASQTSNVPTQPKAFWRAHDSPITCLHRSAFACALFTGGHDGLVRLWDLKTKPTAPVRQYVHRRHITGIAMLDATTMASASADGTIQVWDIRGATNHAPLRSVAPDGTPVLAMAASPLRDTLAVATMKGLYCIEMGGQLGSNGVLAPLTPLPPTGPCLDLRWNERTGEVYVAGRDGALSVYGRS